MRLESRSTVVTGAAQGVGAAIAAAYAGEGAGVVCVDIQEDRLTATVARIIASGGRAVALVGSVADEQTNSAAVSLAEVSFGGLDVFHVNAAATEWGSIEHTSQDAWDRMVAVNLTGAYHGVRAALPALRRRGGGTIVFTSSVAARVGVASLAAYGATKGGLVALARAIAVEHGGENIRCNTICAGEISTEIYHEYVNRQNDPEAARLEIDQTYPLRRVATPADVARVAVFLASDDAEYLTGTDVVVDGGLLSQAHPPRSSATN